ncbi:MAG: tetratricopeptide repeat protein [Pseudomonadota bacterium]
MVKKTVGSSVNKKQLSQADVQGLSALMQAGKLDHAEVKSKKLLRRFPDAPVLYDILSNVRLAKSDFAGAIKSLAKLLEIKPDYENGIYNLGLAQMNIGAAHEAIVSFRRLLSINDKNADAWNNLGAALFEIDSFEEAIEAYKSALEVNPKFVPALRNLGAALRDMRRLDEAVTYLAKIPSLMPRYAPGYLSLGVTHRLLGDLDKAGECFQTVLKLDPENKEANYEWGNILARNGRSAEAIAAYEKVDNAETRAKILEVMHQTEFQDTQLVSRLNELNKTDPYNLRGAAFSAFASQQYDIDETNPFAPDPLNYVSIRTVDQHMEQRSRLLEELATASDEIMAVWENRTTRKGFQTYGNLFEAGDIFQTLEAILRKEIDAYRRDLSDMPGMIIQQFPEAYDLNGWHVKLLKAGYQKPHIHARGWISGVLYLKIPMEMKGDEGAIAFSLHGYDYRKIKGEVPNKVHIPRAGDLVLFPSSLFHHTIPFQSDEERQCIAFDLLPNRN